jgi:hypothetical protein
VSRRASLTSPAPSKASPDYDTVRSDWFRGLRGELDGKAVTKVPRPGAAIKVVIDGIVLGP